jgi:hypothetical protein
MNIMSSIKKMWQDVKEFMNSTVPPEAFQNAYDPEHNSQKHVSDYEHPDMRNAPGGYDY